MLLGAVMLLLTPISENIGPISAHEIAAKIISPPLQCETSNDEKEPRRIAHAEGCDDRIQTASPPTYDFG
jgi:hypothetical protein